jgi:hypothetical protein
VVEDQELTGGAEDCLCFSEVEAVKSVTDAWEHSNQTTIQNAELAVYYTARLAQW